MVDKTKPISKKNRLKKSELRQLYQLLEEFRFELEQEFKKDFPLGNWFDFGLNYDAIMNHGEVNRLIQGTINLVEEEIRR